MSSPQTIENPSGRPILAMIGSTLNPYRIHLHQRLRRELPGLDIQTILTQPAAPQAREANASAGLALTYADHRGPTQGLHRFDFGPQWLVGQNIINFLKRQPVAAAVISGYGHFGHVRVLRYCRRHKIPCILSADSNARTDPSTGLRAFLKRRVLSSVLAGVDAVTVFGEMGRQYFRRYGVPASKLFYAPFEPDYQRFERCGRDEVDRVITKFRFDPRKKRVLFCGRMAEVKRVDLVIDSFSRILHERPDWELVMLGDGPLLPWLRLRVPGDARGRVHFVPFPPVPEEAVAIFKACDVLMLPSSYEPWGLVVNEAAAAGMALVTSDAVGAAADLLVDGVNGRSFACGDRGGAAMALLDATDEALLPARKAASAQILRQYRERSDPVAGLATALRAVGVPPAALARAHGPSGGPEPSPVTGSNEKTARATDPTAAINLSNNARRRPTLAIVGGGLIPYRVHFHRRVQREITEFELLTVNTVPRSRGQANSMDLTGLEIFEADDRVDDPKWAERDYLIQWAAGGRVIEQFSRREMAAVVLNGYINLAHLRVLRWCRENGIPCIMNTDSNRLGDRAKGLRKLAKTLLLRRLRKMCSAVTVFGRLGVEYFVSYGFDPAKVFISPCEPDYDEITGVSEETIRQVGERYGLVPGRRRVVFCGRLVTVKRPDLAVQAFCNIADQRPEFDLVVVGDGVLRQETEALVPERLKSRVIFTGFMKRSEEIAAIYRQCDVFVLPSDYEPWAVVMNEAAVAGCALVASRVVGAAKELIEDGVSGRVTEPGSLTQLTEALLDTTDLTKLADRQAATRKLIDRWRREFDPVAGMKNALRACGLTVA